MSALLEYGSDLYSTKTVKLIPPLPSARRCKLTINLFKICFLKSKSLQLEIVGNIIGGYIEID